MEYAEYVEKAEVVKNKHNSYFNFLNPLPKLKFIS